MVTVPYRPMQNYNRSYDSIDMGKAMRNVKSPVPSIKQLRENGWLCYTPH